MKHNNSTLEQFWFIYKFVAKFLWSTDKKVLVLVIFWNILYSAVIVPNLLLDKLFFDTLVDNIKNPQPTTVFQTILLIVLGRFLLQALRTFSNRLSGYYARLLFMKQNQRIEILIGSKYATISVPTLEDPSFKDRYQRIERESISRLQRVTENFIRIPQHLTGIVSSLSIFIFTQPFVIIFSLLSLIPSALVERIFIKKDYQLDTRIMVTQRLRSMYYYFLGHTHSYLESRLLNIHSYLSNKIREYWDVIISQRFALMRTRRIWGYLAGLVDDIVSYSLDALFAFQVIIGQITIGSAQAYIRAISNFKQSVSNLTASVLELYENYLYLSDLVWFLNLESPYYNESGSKFPSIMSSGIEFKDVWFKYPGKEEWTLKGASFQVSPYQNIALVGKNGAGKTTLVKLLCGFYSPQKGQITVDGINVNDLNKPNYWSKLSILFQDFESYSVTARESIAVSNISQVANTQAIREYAKLTGVDDWISSLPMGYDTPLSRDFEKGTSPSTGQWQRVGIARALFKDPQILILDEPTSNVDPEAEEKIFNEILELGKKKMIIFISHRFSTVRKADNILVLDEGVITESGSHAFLMKKHGTYSSLFTLQAKSYR